MSNEQLIIWLKNNNKFIMKKSHYWSNAEYLKDTLDFDEAYAISLSAVHRSALKFDESKGYQFSTFAGKAIDNTFLVMIRTIKKQKKYVSGTESLDEFIFGFDNSLTPKHELLEDQKVNIEATVEQSIDLERVRKLVKERVIRGLDVLDLVIAGYSQKEIADKLNTSRSNICRIMKKVIVICKKELT